ncbi:MAG: DUF2207 family protein [Solirubrobacterales bacterium]
MTSRRRRPLLALAVGAALCLAAPAAASARSLTVTDADVSMKLAPDAALLVAERLTIEFDGSWEAAYRDILLKKGERISDVTVREGDSAYRPGGCTVEGCVDAEGTYGADGIPSGGGIRIVWHHKASDETRTFTVSYRVEDALVAYSDVLDLEWQVWGDQWDFDLDSLTASLSNPALDPGDPRYRVWGKPRDIEGETSRDPGVALLEASDVREGQFVEMRVTVPRTPQQGVGAARPGEGEGLPAILAEEQENDDEYDSAFNRAKRWIAANALLISLFLAGAAVSALLLLARTATEHRPSVPEYLPEPPDDARPALAYGLAKEGGDSTDTVLATLLDLVDRGYYEATQATTEDEKLDLALAVKTGRPQAKLEPYEREVLEFFDKLLEGDTVPMSEMRDRIPEHSASWHARWEAMTAALNEADEGQLAWDRDVNGKRWLLAGATIAAFAIVILCRRSVGDGWWGPGILGALTLLALVAYPGARLKRLAPEYGARSARWKAFERWTDDFPTLKDDPPATLELWKRILVFGVAFGTAERMIESGRIPAPVMESASAGWSTYYFHGGVSDTAFDGNAFGSGFASQVAPESSSSGGGGGFSGGGGGASGGGGGGGW